MAKLARNIGGGGRTVTEEQTKEEEREGSNEQRERRARQRAGLDPSGANSVDTGDDSGSSGGSGSSETANTADTDKELNVETQTLGTTGMGTTTGKGNDDTTEVTGDPDADASSPAGGTGATDAVERFIGLNRDALTGAAEDSVRAAGQDASDYYTARSRGNEEAAQEAMAAASASLEDAVQSPGDMDPNDQQEQSERGDGEQPDNTDPAEGRPGEDPTTRPGQGPGGAGPPGYGGWRGRTGPPSWAGGGGGGPFAGGSDGGARGGSSGGVIGGLSTTQTAAAGAGALGLGALAYFFLL